MRKWSFMGRGGQSLGVVLLLGSIMAFWTRTPAGAFDNNVWTFPYMGTGSNSTRLAYLNNTGIGMALVGRANSGVALYGSSATGTGVSGDATTAAGYGVVGYNYAGTGTAIGIYGATYSPSGFGVVGRNLGGSSAGVQGAGTTGVQANGTYYGLYATTSMNGGMGLVSQSLDSGGIGLSAQGASTGVTAIGVGNGASGAIGQVNGSGGIGVSGYGGTGGSYGTYGYSDSGIGIFGATSSGFAGYFSGHVSVLGNLSVSGAIFGSTKSFKIDDPRDPAHKYLVHACVESSEMKNVYDGIALLDSDGKADVQMPSYCQTLNGEFRYQLTAVGASAPDLYIAEEMQDNHFQIAGGKPQMKVSWQITGIRHDPYAEAHPMQVEQEKTGKERGRYLDPELYGKPERLGLSSLAPVRRHAPEARLPAPLPPTNVAPAPRVVTKMAGEK